MPANLDLDFAARFLGVLVLCAVGSALLALIVAAVLGDQGDEGDDDGDDDEPVGELPNVPPATKVTGAHRG